MKYRNAESLPDILKASQMAEYLQLSRFTLARFIRQGKIKGWLAKPEEGRGNTWMATKPDFLRFMTTTFRAESKGGVI